MTGNGGLNVIDVSNFNNLALSIIGTANDFFVLNVTGGLHENNPITLSGGITAADILWNIEGGTFQTSGGNASSTILLADSIERT